MLYALVKWKEKIDMKLEKRIAAVVLALCLAVGAVDFIKPVIKSFISAAENSTYISTEPADDSGVYVCVPECLYLTPDTSSATTGQYFINNTMDSSGNISLDSANSATSGKVYLKCGSDISNLTVNLYDWSSTSTSVLSPTLSNSSGLYSNTSIFASGITVTGIAPGTSKTLKWVFKYETDATSMTINAFTTVYSPYIGVIATGFLGRYKSSWDGRANIENITTWVVGHHSTESLTSNSYDCNNGKGTATGAYDNNPLLTSTVTEKSLGRNDDAGIGYLAYTNSGSGYYGGVCNDANGHSEAYGYLALNGTAAVINVDSSRYTNLGYIPNFRTGVDIHEFWCKNTCSGAQLSYGVNKLNPSNGTYTYPNNRDNRGVAPTYANIKTESNTFSGQRRHGERYENSNLSSISGFNITKDSNNTTILDIRGRAYIKPSGGDSYCGYSNCHVLIKCVAFSKASLRASVKNAINAGYQERNYSAASWSAFQSALEAAAKALGQPDATSATVSSAKTTLDSAVNGLSILSGTAKVKFYKNSSKTSEDSEDYDYGDTVITSNSGYSLTGYHYDSYSLFDLEAFSSNSNSMKLGGTGAPENSSASVNSDKTELTVNSGPNGTDVYTTMPSTAAGYDNRILYHIAVSPGATYKLSYTATGSSAQAFVFYLDKNGGLTNGEWNASYNTGDQVISCTMPDHIRYVCFRFGNYTKNTSTVFKNIKFYRSDVTGPNVEITHSLAREYIVDSFYYKANSYQVKYNGNGNTSGSMSNSSHTYDVSKNLTANSYKKEYTVNFNGNNGTPDKTSDTAKATFNGWAKTASGAKEYNNEASVNNLTATNNGTFNLYANWTNGSVSLPGATRVGYTFAGWYSAESGGNLIGNKNGSYTPTENNTTLYAHWNENKYTIKFDANGGTGTMSNISNVSYTASQTLTANSFTKTGYSFSKWNTKANGTGTSYNNQASVSGLSATDGAIVTLYAQWSINKYKLTLNPDNGSGTQEVIREYGSTYEVTNPTKNGYTFQGWELTQGNTTPAS